MHLDTVFTFCDLDVVTLFPDIVDRIATFSLRPGKKRTGMELTRETKPFVEVVAESLGLKKLRVVETGGNTYAKERQQWDSGNNVVALSPGVVVAYDRNTLHEHPASQGRDRSDHDRRRRTRTGAGVAGHCMTCPTNPRCRQLQYCDRRVPRHGRPLPYGRGSGSGASGA